MDKCNRVEGLVVGTGDFRRDRQRDMNICLVCRLQAVEPMIASIEHRITTSIECLGIEFLTQAAQITFVT